MVKCGRQLAEAKLSHAIIDCDELDRVYPATRAVMNLTTLNIKNLSALWRNIVELGHRRVILTGVMLDLNADLTWICTALGPTDITTVRLVASDSSLRARLDAREIGSGKDDQVRRTLHQAARIRAGGGPAELVVQTDGRTPSDIATEILDRAHWTT